MKYKKLIYMEKEQKTALDNIQTKIREKGGDVSIIRLIQDSIQILIDHFSDEAIIRYSALYKWKK